MLPHVVFMVLMLLRSLHHGIEFRQDHLRDTHVISIPQGIRMRGDQQLGQFHLDPLRTDLLQSGCQLPDRRLGVLVDLVA